MSTSDLLQAAGLVVGAFAATYAILAYGGTRKTNREAALANRPRPQLLAFPNIPHLMGPFPADVTNPGGVATSYVLFFGAGDRGLYMARGSLPAHCPPTAVPFTPLGKKTDGIYPPPVALAKGIDGRWWDSWTDLEIRDRDKWLRGWPTSMGMVGMIEAVNIPPVEDFARKSGVRRTLHAGSAGLGRVKSLIGSAIAARRGSPPLRPVPHERAGEARPLADFEAPSEASGGTAPASGATVASDRTPDTHH
jgi:hypothetical protein